MTEFKLLPILERERVSSVEARNLSGPKFNSYKRATEAIETTGYWIKGLLSDSEYLERLERESLIPVGIDEISITEGNERIMRFCKLYSLFETSLGGIITATNRNN